MNSQIELNWLGFELIKKREMQIDEKGMENLSWI